MKEVKSKSDETTSGAPTQTLDGDTKLKISETEALVKDLSDQF